MSRVDLWAPRLLFLCQLLWLLVHGAPVQFQKLALDPVLLTSSAPEEKGPSRNLQEIPAEEPEASEVGEPYPIEEEASSQSAVSPKLLKSLFVNGLEEEHPTTPEHIESSVQQKSSDLLQLPLANEETSFQEKSPAQHSKTSIYLKVTASPPVSGKAPYPVLPYVMKRQFPKNIKILATAKEVTAYFAKFTELVELPRREGAPPEPSETTESSSSQPVLEADAAAPQQPAAPPEHAEEALPQPEPVQPQQPIWSEVTGRPSDLELTLKPDATLENEHPTAPQQPAAPPEHAEGARPRPEPVRPQQPTWSETTGRPSDLVLTIKPDATGENEHPAAPQQPAAPPEHAEEERPHPEPVRPQRPTWSETTGQILNMELTIKPEGTAENEHPSVLQQTTAPPEHPSITFPHPETVHPELPTWAEMTSQTLDQQFFRLHQPVSAETGPPTTGQNVITNICELCTCKNETLSCTGFDAKQKLDRVPVPQPNTYNSNFTVLDLKGNSISNFDKDIWKSYHGLEKLILSGNDLRELRKDSFEGLLFLKYLDLSDNNIKYIEENTFETLPFLEYLNLGGNLLTELNIGTFRAWHGMQFLHTIILHHNPLTTIEDTYLFKLPELKHLDLGGTQVSLATVENILTMTTEMKKLTLPHDLACCLCQFKSNIEAVSLTVKLHCAAQCLKNTRCDEELYLNSAEDSFLNVIQGRESTSVQLTIEPERAPSDKNDEKLSALLSELLDFNDKSAVISALNYRFPYFSDINLDDIESISHLLPLIKFPFSNVQEGDLLMKVLSEQEEAKVSKTEWDANQYKNEETEAHEEEEEEEQELLQRANEMPVTGYVHHNKLLVATPVIVVATVFIILHCLISICGKKKADEENARGFFSSLLKKRSRDSQMEAGGFWSRLKGLFGASKAVPEIIESQNLQDKDSSDESETMDLMEKGEASSLTARTASVAETSFFLQQPMLRFPEGRIRFSRALSVLVTGIPQRSPGPSPAEGERPLPEGPGSAAAGEQV
ncbi:leucine-rich repeat-containing protein 37B-like [Pteronotus mesoamericanus]|uniref:leucine-rich repeat-containing protein 37B-like n=1 Tax=Pteronotus mesoamericanus TaxID=1884717 RepID=UPI0023ED17CF|nr:leucine-rich repeat-containing protein 37B-like [Pteronotus parnellii mesoamericanus]